MVRLFPVAQQPWLSISSLNFPERLPKSDKSGTLFNHAAHSPQAWPCSRSLGVASTLLTATLYNHAPDRSPADNLLMVSSSHTVMQSDQISWKRWGKFQGTLLNHLGQICMMSPQVLIEFLIEVYLVDAFSCLTVENQDLVRVSGVRAEAGNVEIPIGAKR